MTSVDSGVETGNDSNDSLVAQHENIPVGQASVSTTAFMPTASKMEAKERQSDAIAINLRSIASFRSNLENYITSTNNMSLSNRPGTSGPLTFHPSDSLPVLEWSFPAMCANGSLYSTMEFKKSLCRDNAFSISDNETNSLPGHCFKPKMRIYRFRRNYIEWKQFKGPLNERNMRLAASTNNIDMIRSLLEKGTSPNNKDAQKRTPLHLASCRGYTEIVRLLLEHGADPNQRDCIGNTPLHLAAVTSKISVVTLLLKAGTSVLSSDKHGHNPLQIAQTKLKMLQTFQGADMVKIKEEVNNVVDMLLAYLEKQKNAQDQVENLSNFYSRLSLSNTSNQIQDDVRDLLANLNSLSLTR